MSSMKSRLLLVAGTLALLAHGATAWTPKQAPLMTQWAKTVDRNHPWPEYPRPQMVRADWLNLNGVWQFQPGAEGDAVPAGQTLSSAILVPFPVESALSGIMEHHDRLWYRRRFVVPPAWGGKQVRLNFGAVDFESEVYVNGKSVGLHKGGYLPFSYDVTPYLTGSGPQELIVRVFDPTDAAGEPRGKQSLKPRRHHVHSDLRHLADHLAGTCRSRTSVKDLKIVPDIDRHLVRTSR